MKLTALAKFLVLPFAFASAASAAAFTWAYTTTAVPLDFLQEGTDTSFASEFDLTTVTSVNPIAFNPTLHVITEARVYFAFADDQPGTDGSANDVAEYVDIFLGGTATSDRLWDDLQVDGAHPSSSFAWYDKALPAGFIASLQDDGKISYSVQLQNLNTNSYSTYTYKREDTYLKVAAIVAKGDSIPPPVNVPDSGSTVASLGVVLLAAAALRKGVRN